MTKWQTIVFLMAKKENKQFGTDFAKTERLEKVQIQLL